MPVFFLLAGVNYFGDVGNLFSKNLEKKIADLILQGKNVANTISYDERQLQRYIITNDKSCKDIVVLGSSRTMQINSSDCNSSSFINNSVSGASLEDLVAIYELYEHKKCKPSRIIMGLDPWTLNRNNGQVRWQTLSQEYNLFLKSQKMDTVVSYYFMHKYYQLLSPSYFHNSFKSLFLKKQPKAIDSACAIGMIRHSDGSICYDLLLRSTTVPEVNDKARQYAENEIYGIENFEKPSPGLIQILDKFVASLRHENIEVVFYLSPYHPLVYRKIVMSKKYKAVIDSELYFRQLATKYQCKVLGSFNPGSMFPDGTFFFDGMHLREKGIRVILGNDDHK